MRNLLETTGIGSFLPGQKLTSETLNVLNARINELVRTTNYMLKSHINVNIEEENPNGVYSLDTILLKVPVDRRSRGIKIRFREDSTGDWIEYVYVGANTEDNNWYEKSNWAKTLSNIVDGGEW